MLIILELTIAISAITIFFITRRICIYKKRYAKLEQNYNRLVGCYSSILKRIQLYEIVLTRKEECREAIEAAAEIDIEENGL